MSAARGLRRGPRRGEDARWSGDQGSEDDGGDTSSDGGDTSSDGGDTSSDGGTGDSESGDGGDSSDSSGTDTGFYGACTKVDVIFAVDNSGSAALGPANLTAENAGRERERAAKFNGVGGFEPGPAAARHSVGPRRPGPCHDDGPMFGPAPARLHGLLALVAMAWACREPTPTPAHEPATVDAPTPREPAPPSVEMISEDPVVQAIVTLAEADSQVDDHARALAVDIGPRLTGSGALINAERWAEAQLAGWGLEARRERWGELAVGFERGPARGAQVRPERRELAFTTDAWSPGTRDLVRAQAVVWPGDDAQLRARKPYLRNAWVLVPWGTSTRDATGKRMAAAIDKAGIAGLIYAAGGPEDTRIHTQGQPWEDWKHLPTRVELRLRGDQHAELVRAALAGEVVQLEFSVDNHFTEGPLPQHNVIADLPGDAHPEQVVIIGGHLDSWDGASGAVDNATGVATAMEAARLIAAACEQTGERPDRTIRVMLWTGEEQGLLGSQGWVRDHHDDLADISAVLVHDGGTNYISGLPVTPEMHADMQRVFAPVLALEARRAALDPGGEAMPFRLRVVESLIFEPSDSYPFIEADVPGFYWDQAGRSDYEQFHHTQHDHVAAIIDEYQRRSALVVAIAAWNLAQAPDLVSRVNAGPLAPRRLGVLLDDDLQILEVLPGSGGSGGSGDGEGVGAAAGLQAGDRLLAIDGQEISDARGLHRATRSGEPRKPARVERSGAEVEVILDWSNTEAERERARREQERRQKFGPESWPESWSTPAEGQPGPQQEEHPDE